MRLEKPDKNSASKNRAFEVLDERFRQEPGKTLADLLRQVEARMRHCPAEGLDGAAFSS